MFLFVEIQYYSNKIISTNTRNTWKSLHLLYRWFKLIKNKLISIREILESGDTCIEIILRKMKP